MPPETTAKDRADRIVEDATRRLIAELEAGRSDALREYLGAMGRFHHYSWTNTILIQSQRPTATRVAGYHTWRDLGRSVRRGEKGVVIYAPVVARNDRGRPALLPGERPLKEREVVGFRAAYVFDVSQTEGKPLPVPARTRGDPAAQLDRLKEVVAARGIGLEYDPSIAPADGLSTGGLIKLRPGLDHAEEFSVLTHELAHELLHQGERRSEINKTVRETEAEAVAYVVSHGIGLDTNSAARDYISLYDGNATTLTESLAAVQRASSEILRELLPKEREPEDRSNDRAKVAEPELPQQLELGGRVPLHVFPADGRIEVPHVHRTGPNRRKRPSCSPGNGRHSLR
jgi:antirestriction protein ArdC